MLDQCDPSVFVHIVLLSDRSRFNHECDACKSVYLLLLPERMQCQCGEYLRKGRAPNRPDVRKITFKIRAKIRAKYSMLDSPVFLNSSVISRGPHSDCSTEYL